MRTRRVSIQQQEIAKAVKALQALGAKVASVKVEPGSITITTTDGVELTPGADVAEIERAKENWGSHGRKSKAA